MVKDENAMKWLLIGGAIVFWVILSAAFGVNNVRSAVRAFVFLIIILALFVILWDKISLALRRSYTPTEPRRAYFVTYRRSADGKMVEGVEDFMIWSLCEGKRGFTVQPNYGISTDEIDAKKKAEELNAQAGLSERDIKRILQLWS